MRRIALVASFALFLALAGRPSTARSEEPTGAAPAADAAEREKWRDHMGDLPFVVGHAKGNAQAAASGRPPMYFFTATW